MIQPILTRGRQDATYSGMKKMLLLLAVGSPLLVGGCVQVQAPSKPIEINLNVNIKQEVIVSLKKDAGDLVNQNPDLFPK